jgi:hypothetical protein
MQDSTASFELGNSARVARVRPCGSGNSVLLNNVSTSSRKGNSWGQPIRSRRRRRWAGAPVAARGQSGRGRGLRRRATSEARRSGLRDSGKGGQEGDVPVLGLRCSWRRRNAHAQRARARWSGRGMGRAGEGAPQPQRARAGRSGRGTRVQLARARRDVPVSDDGCLSRMRTSRKLKRPNVSIQSWAPERAREAGEGRRPSAAMLCSARRRPSRAGRTRLPTRQRVDASEFLEASPVRGSVPRGKPGRVMGEPSAYSVLSQRWGVVRGRRPRYLGAAGEGGEARDGPTELEALSCEAVQLKRGGVSRDGPAEAEAAFAEAVQLKRGGVSGETVPLKWRPTLAKRSS